MSRPSAASRLISDSRWNLAAFVISLLSNVVALPMVIAAIGLEQFGVAGLVLAGFAPFSVLGAILGQSLVRDLASPQARDDMTSSRRRVTVSVVWCAVGCVLMAILTATAGSWLMKTLRPPQPSGSQDVWLLSAGYGAWFFQQWCFIAQGILSGRQAFKGLALANAVGTALAAGAVVLACTLMHTDVALLLGTSVGFCIQTFLLWAAVSSESRQLLALSRWTGSESSALASFFGWQGSAHLAGSVANQVDRYVLGATASSAVVGQYNVAMRVQEVVHLGVLKMGEVLLPHFSSTSTLDSATRSHFFQRASWAVNILSVAALAPLIPLGPALISLWIDERAAVMGGPMLQTLATAGVLGSGLNVFTFFALGTNQSRRLATINLAHSVVLVVLAIALISWLGPLAAGWAYVASNFMRCCAAFWFSLDHFAGDLRLGQLALASAAPLAVGVLAGWGLSEVVGAKISGWIGFGVGYAVVASAVVLMTLLITLLNPDGRIWVRSLREVMWKRVQRNARGM